MNYDESKRSPEEDDVFEPPEKTEGGQEEQSDKGTPQKIRALAKDRVLGIAVGGLGLMVGLVLLLVYSWGGSSSKNKRKQKIGAGAENAEQQVTELENSADNRGAEKVGDQEGKIRGKDVGFGRAEKLQRRLEKRVENQGGSGGGGADVGTEDVGPWDKAQKNARRRRAQAYFQEEFQSDRAGVFEAGESMNLADEQAGGERNAGEANGGSGDQITPDEMRQRIAESRQRVASQVRNRRGGRRADEEQLEAFVQGQRNGEGGTRNVARLKEPVGEYVVQAGTMLPLVLETGINSQLPGRIRGRFSRPVYDSVTGKHVLIPAGSTVVGEYNAEVEEGQSRAQVVWTRLLLPNGKSLKLDRVMGTSLDGKTGYEDRVDNQWGSVGAGVVLTSLLSAGAGAAGGTRNEFRRQPGESALNAAGQNVSEQGQTIVERELEKEPIVKIRPGLEVSAFVHKDLVLEPYRGENE
jgi:type IV secretion system protein VirB10